MFRPVLLASLLATPALADEVWDSRNGEIVYEREIDGAAVFSFRTDGGDRATLVIPGLAGNYDARGVHDAFWLGTGPGYCLGSMAFDGAVSPQWGRALLIFDTPAYPTSFTLLMGDCLDPPGYSLRAEIR